MTVWFIIHNRVCVGKHLGKMVKTLIFWNLWIYSLFHNYKPFFSVNVSLLEVYKTKYSTIVTATNEYDMGARQLQKGPSYGNLRNWFELHPFSEMCFFNCRENSYVVVRNILNQFVYEIPNFVVCRVWESKGRRRKGRLVHPESMLAYIVTLRDQSQQHDGITNRGTKLCTHDANVSVRVSATVLCVHKIILAYDRFSNTTCRLSCAICSVQK